MASSGKGNTLFSLPDKKMRRLVPRDLCLLVGWSVNIELVVVGGGVVKFPRAGRDSN